MVDFGFVLIGRNFRWLWMERRGEIKDVFKVFGFSNCKESRII